MLFLVSVYLAATHASGQSEIGREVAIPRHLQDGEEFDLSPSALIRYGKQLFEAHFTVQEGAGRPLSKGTGAPLSRPSSPLRFPRNNNRVSGPDSNSCAGCHNQPISGGAGDLSSNVFVLGQRFDFATFDGNDLATLRGAMDERGKAATLQSIANSRSTVDMFGSGYYEMLARQITTDLQSIRDRLKPGQQARLQSKEISFGMLARNGNGIWNTAAVEGLCPESLVSSDSQHPPSLLILPFHQAGATVSLRAFTNDAFNQHQGMQSTERFGIGMDPDGDGVTDELTRADITACTLFQATLPAPRRAWPRDPAAQRAASALSVDLADDELPQPRLKPANGTVMVPLYTDFKVHDICAGPNDPNGEVLDANQPVGSVAFFAGNAKFLTRRLWAVGSKPNYFHHGQFTTIREAILAHAGEALASREAFSALSPYGQGAVVEFLKGLKAPGASE